MHGSEPAPLPGPGDDPDDDCHDCETAAALGMEPWCDDPGCRPGSGSGGGRGEPGAGQADEERGGSP